MKLAILLILICCFFSSCSSLVLKERERMLDESFEKGKITRVQYLSSMNELKQERAEMSSSHK